MIAAAAGARGPRMRDGLRRFARGSRYYYYYHYYY